MKTQRGFTYVELVTLVFAVSVFSLAVLPGISRQRCKSRQAHCVSNLQRVGLALQVYCEDNRDTLPGPVSLMPRAGYDQAATHELSWYLAEALGCPKASSNLAIARGLLCPAYRLEWSEPSALAAARTYVLNDNVSKRGGNRVPPFGSLVPPYPAPLNVSTLATYGPLMRLSAMTDADKGTVSPRILYWKDVPYRPVHGRARSRLFFDGHVEVKPW